MENQELKNIIFMILFLIGGWLLYNAKIYYLKQKNSIYRVNSYWIQQNKSLEKLNTE